MQRRSMTQVLGQKQSARLAPQLQDGVRLLQLSSAELQEEIDSVLEKNPFLEKLDFDSGYEAISSLQAEANTDGTGAGEKGAHASPVIHGSSGSYPLAQRQPGSAAGGSQAGSRIDPETPLETARELSLHEYLLQQARATPLSDKQHHVLEILVDCVNDKGYLRASVDEVMQVAMPDFVVSRKDVAEMIAVLQTFEPVGVGARSASECLRLQLDELPAESPGLEHAHRIVAQHLLLLAKKDYRGIAGSLGLSDAELQAAIALIRQLDPFPGLRVSPSEVQAIVPDLVARRDGDRWMVRLNPNIAPAIVIHDESAEWLKLARGQAGYEKLKQSLDDARSLLSNIQRRYLTLLRVATQAVDLQKDFLDKGERALIPLTRQALADRLEIHVSTVSRAVNGKYIQTPAGVMPLSSFFSGPVSAAGGEAHSARAIREQIRELIEAEDKAAPLSDEKISRLLQGRGIKLARRTVMKYRAKLGIPVASKRRTP